MTNSIPSSVRSNDSAGSGDQVTVFDVSDRTQIEISGSDRIRFLHSFTTNDIKQLTTGRGCETFVTTVQGKILAHVFAFCGPDSLWLDGMPGQEAALLRHLGKYVLVDDVQLIPHTSDRGELYVVGSNSAEFFGLTQIPSVLSCAATFIAEIAAEIRRVDLWNEPGFLISVRRDDVGPLREQLLARGAKSGSSEMFETRRIAGGFPRYGVDFSDGNLAQEAGRTKSCISFTKGCYLGQETVARLDSMGHTNQELRQLTFESPAIPDPGTTLYDAAESKEVGRITSAALVTEPTSTTGQSVVAIALVKRAAYAPGTRLCCHIRDNLITGIVL